MPLRAVNVHFLSHLTPHTFISGFTWRNRDENDPERDGSLLSRIKNGIIVCKDFTQVLSMPMRERGPVLADLRDIYDGYIEKPFAKVLSPSDRLYEHRIADHAVRQRSLRY